LTPQQKGEILSIRAFQPSLPPIRYHQKRVRYNRFTEATMKLKLDLANPFWWFWALTLACITAAVAGWTPGYYFVIAISAVQLIVFLARERSLTAFPSQIRLVYFGWTLTGLWKAGRLPFYLLLFLGTAMVVFFGRCSIALILKHMPWNRGRAVRLV
jgi:hypothetical protein